MTRHLTETYLRMAQYPRGDDRLIITRDQLSGLIDVATYASRAARKAKDDDMEASADAVKTALCRSLGRPADDEHLHETTDDDMDWETDDELELDADEPDDDTWLDDSDGGDDDDEPSWEDEDATEPDEDEEWDSF